VRSASIAASSTSTRGLYLTSSFVFENAAQAADRSATTPPETSIALHQSHRDCVQERLAALEGAQACVATASECRPILATAMATLKAATNVVCSSGVFGATVQLFSRSLSKFGIETTYADGNRASVWKAAIRPNTRLLFLRRRRTSD